MCARARAIGCPGREGGCGRAGARAPRKRKSPGRRAGWPRPGFAAGQGRRGNAPGVPDAARAGRGTRARSRPSLARTPGPAVPCKFRVHFGFCSVCDFLWPRARCLDARQRAVSPTATPGLGGGVVVVVMQVCRARELRPRAQGPGCSDGRRIGRARDWVWVGWASDGAADRKSTRLNSSHSGESRMPSSA